MEHDNAALSQPEENNAAPAESAPVALSGAKNQKKSPNFIVLVLVAIAVLAVGVAIVVAVIVANQKPVAPPAPKPGTEPEPEPTSFIIDGKAFLSVDDHQSITDLADSFVAHKWEDITDYFTPAVQAYAKEQYQTPDVKGDLEKAKDTFDFSQGSYAIVRYSDGGCSSSVMGVGITSIKDGVANVLFEIDHHCGLCAVSYSYYAFPLGKNAVTKIKTESKTVKTETCDPDIAYKPVIYLYPAATTNVTVKLGTPERLRVSYPQYTSGWQVKAQPDGTLTDLATGRQLYALYYEANRATRSIINDHGFVVKGADAARFLEQKLAQLGLNEREAEEFIIYWLPQLQDNKYNYIYFALTDETAADMPLDVSPQPDTVIRFTMEYSPLQTPLQIPEQQLPATPERKGFTLVEWGGTPIRSGDN